MGIDMLVSRNPSAHLIQLPSSSERTLQALVLQDASDASQQDSSQLGQPSTKANTTTMNSTLLYSLPPNQGYQEQQQSMWVQDASDPSQDSSSQLGQPTKENTTTMNSSTLLYSLPPKNQGYQEQQKSMCWVDNKSRNKSKAIAIKRNNNRCHEECCASLSEASSERMYDRATWCMYNLIVDHRRRNQRQHTTTSTSLPLAMDHHHANQGLPHLDDRMHAEDRFQESRGTADYIHDGEVFELEDL